MNSSSRLCGVFRSVRHAVANDRCVREADGRCRRLADIAGHDRGRLSWAESAPIGVDSGRTGVRAKAGVLEQFHYWRR